MADDRQIQFYDSYVPSLSAGRYTIEVRQQLGVPGAEQEDMKASRTVQVVAPQIGIDPADIHAVAPPNGASGPFGDELPHMVLNRRALPWERGATGTPWIALLLLTTDEMAPGPVGEPDAPSGAMKTTAAEFVGLQGSEAIYVPEIALDPGVQPDAELLYIAITPETFTTLMPRAEEVSYLAHARNVEILDSLTADNADPGWFATVIGNRFPVTGGGGPTGTRNTVHVVSLEDFRDKLSGDATFKRSDGDDYPFVGLISLARWSFSVLEGGGDDFAALMKRLVEDEIDPETGAPNPDRLRLTLRTETSSDVANGRLNAGYAPVPYHARSGEESFAWYRGPLAPTPVKAIEPEAVLPTADAALIYDPENGVFDSSLAAAWQIGQLMALADGSYRARLEELKRRSQHLALTAAAQTGDLTSAQRVDRARDTAPAHERLLRALSQDLLSAIGEASRGGLSQDRDRQRPEPGRTPLTEILSDPEAARLIADALRPEHAAVAETLAGWQLLESVPFTHLAPDARMLPNESIRFFYLDRNWLSALMDGATSLSLHTDADLAWWRASRGQILDDASRRAAARRSAMLGVEPAPRSNTQSRLAGFLLRSTVVAGWPGLAIRGMDTEGFAIPLLRLARLSGTVLLALFDGVPDRVELSEPAEGLQFGVSPEGTVPLRSLVDDPPLGSQLGADFVVRPAHLRAEGVLDLRPDAADGLIQSMAAKIAELLRRRSMTLSPSDFALEMVKAPRRQVFTAPKANRR